MKDPTPVAMDTPRIHETAIVHPSARLSEDVTVGPYCLIGPDVELGPGCVLESHVRIDGPLVAGSNNRFFHGAAIGGVPQDLKFDGANSRVRIGDGNVFREYVTVNRATDEGRETVIGNRNLLMAYVHIAHDCILHDHIILANSVNLAGHVEVEDCAIVGGLTPVHQFVRLGRYSITGGASRAAKDMPPFLKSSGNPIRVIGPNNIGLSRHGFPAEARRAVKEAYRLLYRCDLNVSQAVERIREQLPDSPEAAQIVDFIERSDRGIVR